MLNAFEHIQCMDQLPDLVVAAIKAGLAIVPNLESTKGESIQGEKGLLVQLRWRPVTSLTMEAS